VEKARNISHDKKEVSDFFTYLSSVLKEERFSKLPHFFIQFIQHPCDIWPIEPHPGGLLCQLMGLGKGRRIFGYPF
jgi:hypothetical protein